VPELSLNDWLAYGLLLFLFVAFGIAYLVSWIKRKQSTLSSESKNPIDAILHHSAERGEGVLIALSDGDSGQIGSLTALAGLQTAGHVFRHSLNNDTAPKAMAGDGALSLLSQQLCAGTYHNAVMPELFRLESSALAGLGSFAYLAGLMPEISRPNLNALVMQGELNSELLLAMDLGVSQGKDTLISSSSLSGQVISYLANPHSALGAEAFLNKSTRPREKAAHDASLITLKVMGALIVAGLIVAVLLHFLGVLP